jgi:glycosyltransferase involved in cell wall biosynthesis
MYQSISVVIPVYNKVEYIERSISSLLDQIDKPEEIIIIDDFSSDGSFELVEKFTERSGGLIKLYRNHINMGVSFTRNRGIEFSSSKFIMFLDADDLYDINCIKTVRSYLEKFINERMFIFKCRYADSRVIYPLFPSTYEPFDSGIFKFDDKHTFVPFVGGSNVVLNLEFVKKSQIVFDVEESNFEDWSFYFRLLIQNNLEFVLINAPLYHYFENILSGLSKKQQIHSLIKVPKVIEYLSKEGLNKSSGLILSIWLSSAYDKINSRLNYLRFLKSNKGIISQYFSFNRYFIVVMLKFFSLGRLIILFKKNKYKSI